MILVFGQSGQVDKELQSHNDVIAIHRPRSNGSVCYDNIHRGKWEVLEGEHDGA
jgi:hypothetical protein